jgi:capsid protein
MKDINASVKALDANMTTLQAVCAESGKDWLDVLRQRKIEQDHIKKMFGEEENADESEAEANGGNEPVAGA